MWCRADVALTAVLLTACAARTAVAQPASPPDPSGQQPESDSTAPSGPRRPRVDIAAGLTGVRVRELPPRDSVGQGALSVFVSAGYRWNRRLATQVEIASQVEPFGWDYAHERLVASDRATTITLRHNYEVSRWTVAQLVQLGQGRLQPYLGAGVGIESQSTYDTWHESTVVLGPDATAVSESPDTRRNEADHVIVFAEAGARIFVGRHAFLLLDWKAIEHAKGKWMFGAGIRLP